MINSIGGYSGEANVTFQIEEEVNVLASKFIFLRPYIEGFTINVIFYSFLLSLAFTVSLGIGRISGWLEIRRRILDFAGYPAFTKADIRYGF